MCVVDCLNKEVLTDIIKHLQDAHCYGDILLWGFRSLVSVDFPHELIKVFAGQGNSKLTVEGPCN